MKLIALLSFFAEDWDYLAGDVEDLHALGVSVIIAVDGSYSHYDGPARSPAGLVEDLYHLTSQHDMSLLLYQPTEPWRGDEVEKRQVMIDLAWSIADAGDWFVIWDCDYALVESPDWAYIARKLMLTQEIFATISFTEANNDDDGWHAMQMFVRAQPVKMDGNHHTYLLADGRRSQILRRPVPNMADALDLSEIKVRHRVHERNHERRAKQTAYYDVRDREGLET